MKNCCTREIIITKSDVFPPGYSVYYFVSEKRIKGEVLEKISGKPLLERKLEQNVTVLPRGTQSSVVVFVQK